MELAISEAKLAGDRGDYPIGAVITRLVGQARSGDCQCRQSRENFGLEHQTRGTGNAEVRMQRLRALPARFCSVLDARALRDVRRRLRVVQNRRGGLRRFAGRHRRVRAQARHRSLQVASVLNLVRVRFSQGQSPHSGIRRISATRNARSFSATRARGTNERDAARPGDAAKRYAFHAGT